MAGRYISQRRTTLAGSPHHSVILSGAGTSQSEVPAESKDPCTFSVIDGASGILPAVGALVERLSLACFGRRFMQSDLPQKRGERGYCQVAGVGGGLRQASVLSNQPLPCPRPGLR